jgi:hypothetical protein
VDIFDQLAHVRSRGDLAEFLVALRSDLEVNQNKWENPVLDRYLGALEALVRSWNADYLIRSTDHPSAPQWRDIAEFFFYAHSYE